MISVHVEVLPHLHRTLGLHQEPWRQGGRRESIRPRRSSRSRTSRDDLDFVLVMSVNPGFGGQSFIPHSLDKVRR
jgi:ribulose-phosphate 3-epimerase